MVETTINVEDERCGGGSAFLRIFGFNVDGGELATAGVGKRRGAELASVLCRLIDRDKAETIFIFG